MATRYWVSGTGTWDGSDTSHWSASSGGSGGASVPTASDDVIFNSSSGGGTCTIASNPRVCLTLTTTGYTGTLATAGNDIKVSGTVVIGSSTTLTNSGGNSGRLFISSAGNLTTNGVSIPCFVFSANVSLQDALTTTRFQQVLGSGTFTSNNNAMTIGQGDLSGVTLGSSVVTFTQDNSGSAGLGRTCTIGSNFSGASATLKLTSNGSNDKSIYVTGSSVTIGTVWYAPTSTPTNGRLYLENLGSDYTIGTLKCSDGNAKIRFKTGAVVTISTDIAIFGTSGNLVTIDTQSAGSAATISKSSGVQEFVYCSIKDITASGGASFFAYQSTNVSGNSGITFSAASGARYWVGGTGTWNTTNLTNWALSSGGTGGHSFPGSGNDATMNGSSGGGTITLGSGSNICAAWITTGFTGTLSGSSALELRGALTVASGLTWSYTGTITFAGSTSVNITTNGKSLSSPLVFNNASGVWTLQDALTTTGGITLTNGGLVANNFAVTCADFSSNNTNTRALNLGTNTWTLTGTGGWTVNASNLTLTESTSTIKFTSTGAANITFAGGGETYYNLWFSRGTNTNSNILTGANTFNDLKDDGTGEHTLTLPNGVTTTVASFTVSGAVGKYITVNSASVGNQATLSKPSGTVNCSRLKLKDNAATGGATWNATISLNQGNVTGWNITALVFPAGLPRNQRLTYLRR